MEPPWQAKAKWIWLPNYDDSRNPGSIVLFRHVFTLDEADPSLTINVSADSRYRLFLNGQSISIGPCKGTPLHWYYETIDATPIIRPGKNVLAAQVLRYSPAHRGNVSVMRAGTPGFILLATGRKLSLPTDEQWRCFEDNSVTLLGHSNIDRFLSVNETVHGHLRQFGWESLDFDDSAWPFAKSLLIDKPLEYTSMLPWSLHKREIPPLTEIPRRFKCALNLRRSSGKPTERVVSDWNSLLRDQKPLKIAAYDEIEIDIEAPEHSTGYPSLTFGAGKGANVQILFAESYELTPRDSVMPTVKGMRTNFLNGYLNGVWDTYVVAGRESETYETFWFRTFRYVRLIITTQDQPLDLFDISYRQTNYPLEIRADFNSSSAPKFSQFWDISLRTLKNCMHETYEDCPYYEQSQFGFDTRIQILLTYIISGDDRLARKAIHDFHTSLRPDGLIMMRYPAHTNIILPGFSLFFPYLVYDHMMYYGDIALAKRYFPSIDAILSHFDRKLRPDGLVQRFSPNHWSFIDWVPAWPHGAPDAARVGPGTYFSLAYAMALECSARVAKFIGRPGLASEYLTRRTAVVDAVNKHCFDGNWYYDGPISNMVDPPSDWRSQHCQVFAILAGALNVAESRELMERTLQDPFLHRMSTSQAFYLFRALDMTGLYDKCHDLWHPWETMLAQGLDTWAEEEVNPRSDCHAWSTIPLYELSTAIVGVKPSAPGFAITEVKPQLRLLEAVNCSVWTAKGMLRIHWEPLPRDSGGDQRQSATRRVHLTIDGPQDLQINLEVEAGQDSKPINFQGHYDAVFQVKTSSAVG